MRYLQTQLNVTYPLFQSKFLSEPLDLKSTLGGVELDASGNFIKSAKAWMLVYQLKQQRQELNQISRFSLFLLCILLIIF